MENIIQMWSKVEEVLDNHNAEKGSKEELCVFCKAKRYDSKQGIIHFFDCPIITIRLKYLQNKRRL